MCTVGIKKLPVPVPFCFIPVSAVSVRSVPSVYRGQTVLATCTCIIGAGREFVNKIRQQHSLRAFIRSIVYYVAFKDYTTRWILIYHEKGYRPCCIARYVYYIEDGSVLVFSMLSSSNVLHFYVVLLQATMKGQTLFPKWRGIII